MADDTPHLQADAEDLEAVSAPAVAPVIQVAEAADSTETADSTEAADSAEIAETAETADSADSAETGEAAEVPESVEPAEAAEAPESAEAVASAESQPEAARRTPIPLPEKVARAEAAAERLLSLVGVEATGIAGRVDGEQVILQVDEINGPAELDNRAYEALQFMLNKAINRGAARRTRLSLQSPGFRGRRSDGLGRVAAHLSHKARKLGMTLSIGPLQSKDLRALSVQLKRQKGLQLETQGEGDLQRLVIAPVAQTPQTTQARGADEGEGTARRRRRRRKRRRS